MIGLTAWISAMVGAMGVWFTSVMPLLLLALCWPLAMLNFLHYIWAKLNGLWNPNRDRNTEVFYSVNEKESKNGRIYYESNWDKFFHKPWSIYMYVIPKDGLPFTTDESSEYFMNDYWKWESWDRIEGAVRNIEDNLEFDRSEWRRIDTFWKAYDEADNVWLWTHKLK